jgi:hypothetical protein
MFVTSEQKHMNIHVPFKKPDSNRFAVHVWKGITGDLLLGPYELPP